MTLIDDFRPLLPFFRFLAVWVYFVTCILSGLAGFGIISIVEIILTGIGFFHCLTVGILGHKAKYRQRALSTPSVEEAALPKHPIVVICIDFFLATCLLVIVGFQLFFYSFDFRDDRFFNANVFLAHAYIGALVAAHLELFFSAVTLHMWRQLRHGRKAAAAFERRERRRDETNVGEPAVTNSEDSEDPQSSA